VFKLYITLSSLDKFQTEALSGLSPFILMMFVIFDCFCIHTRIEVLTESQNNTFPLTAYDITNGIAYYGDTATESSSNVIG